MLKKWLKRLSDKKGAAMVLVIVVIVILSTLGLAILSLSVANFRLSLVDKKTTLSFYMAESGLEQAYEIILTNVKQAVAEAKAVVNSNVEAFIAAERTHMETETTYDSEYIVGDDPAGPIDIDKLKEKLRTDASWLADFQDRYKQYLSDNLVRALEDDSNYKVIDVSVSNEIPEIDVVNPSDPLFTGNNTRVLKLTSLYNKEEYLEGKKISEKVEMNFNIKVPSEIPDTIYVNTAATTIENNPIYDNAFVCSKLNLVFEGGTKVRIDGDCYAYGAMKASDPNNLHEYGGFTINKNNNNIIVNGDVSTYHVVQHKGKVGYESQYSNLTINGNVFTNNLLINKGLDKKTIQDTITVNGDVYTSHDLIMYGDSSTFDINGNWYGTTADSEIDNSQATGTCVIDIDATHLNATEKAVETEFRRKQFDKDFIKKHILVNEDASGYLSMAVPETIQVNTTTGGSITYDYSYGTNYYTLVKPGSDDEVYIVNNDSSKTVFFIAENNIGKTYTPPNNAIIVDITNKDIKGAIFTVHNIRFTGEMNYTGLAVSLNNCIHFYWSNKIKIFKADRSFLKAKAAELGTDNPFRYDPPASSPYPWPPKSETVGTAGDIGVGDSISLDLYKDLISVSDWQKL